MAIYVSKWSSAQSILDDMRYSFGTPVLFLCVAFKINLDAVAGKAPATANEKNVPVTMVFYGMASAASAWWVIWSHLSELVNANRRSFMVKMQESSDSDKLESVLKELCDAFGYRLYVEGWTRKTYDVFTKETRSVKAEHLARLESLATTSGEIRCFDDRALDFAKKVGDRLEGLFGIDDAVIIRSRRPEY